jgi:hypothetical protein
VQYQPSSTQAQLPTQDEEKESQDGGNDQGGVEEEQDKNDEDEVPPPISQVPHQRVHHTIQRDHPMDMILGDINKGVRKMDVRPFASISFGV